MARLVPPAAFASGVGLSALSGVSASAVPFGAKPSASSPVGGVNPGTGKPTPNQQPPGAGHDSRQEVAPARHADSGDFQSSNRARS
jgi:hypothetical protein